VQQLQVDDSFDVYSA